MEFEIIATVTFGLYIKDFNIQWYYQFGCTEWIALLDENKSWTELS